eukprot:CAMPEP_0113945448 /NCGR_PEP_ID=MMETSP1339-20121228/45976_1 /TAXON_ID=94617 /ORGANISM="Fibrocapsa japonica" /LENGTH=192 /DNA_ID=CAMNT_0000951033 /DNA_START=36 /DNA_END=614 /DNA_ORIENTATION=- /assembly_acc=CAM_ASM_000762
MVKKADRIPVVSQAKSLVQVCSGDAKGARKTQENFLKQCPVVSQGTSAVQAICYNDHEAARETQLEFLGAMNDLADGTPVVGHIKGGIHYMCGDSSGGEKAMKSATRTTGVVGGSVAGFVCGGPAGAVGGGIAAGAAMDGIITGVESKVHQEYRPSGHLAMVNKIHQKVQNGENAAGEIFDEIAMVVFDGES